MDLLLARWERSDDYWSEKSDACSAGQLAAEPADPEMKGAGALFEFLLQAAARDERCALVTITDIVGSSSRAPGTHMVVSETGAHLGSLSSGGCIEAAVVGEALRIIESGGAEMIRFGAGSRFIDIRLPCGGGIDLLFTPLSDMRAIFEAQNGLRARQSIALALDTGGGVSTILDPTDELSGWSGSVFLAYHAPVLRLVIVGHGEESRALATLAIGYGMDVTLLTPDRALLNDVTAMGAQGHYLRTQAPSPHLKADCHSAIVMLFHDHDWEEELLVQALTQDAFFIGAMGSRRTHAQRVQALRRRHVPDRVIDRLSGPIGLIPSARDPQTLALSALSEVVRDYAALRESGRSKPTCDVIPFDAMHVATAQPMERSL